MMNVNDIRETFRDLFNKNEFQIDKSGVKTLEIIGATYLANEDVIFGNLNLDYAQRELEWYKSKSLNVYDIPGNVPEIWKQVASRGGLINSNYGWCIFSENNFSQYNNCLKELKKNKYSRRAIMIYTRPGMQYEYNTDGMSDFICTNNVSIFIRNDRLHYVINQRSCDAVFGYKNDIFWHKYVHNLLLNDLLETYPELKLGDLIHQVGSLHVYERHFKFINN